MISPELLRRYPFFGIFNDSQLKEIAMISEETSAEPNSILFKKGEPAQALYVLLEGSIDLIDYLTSNADPTYSKEFLAGEMEPGSVLAISALVEPYLLTVTAKVTQKSRLLVIDGRELQRLANEDLALGYALMRQVAKLAIERMVSSRALLAALLSQGKDK